jgi:DNA-binding winged helix-turn-helix (wHTH) protein/Tol biopolymer transport system component
MGRPYELIELGTLRLDTIGNQLLDGDQIIQVEPRLVQVLVFLYQHRGEVVTRTELIEKIWQGQVVSSNALSRSISQIRRLLSHSLEPQPTIDTIPKVGYKLVLRSCKLSNLDDTLDQKNISKTLNVEQNERRTDAKNERGKTKRESPLEQKKRIAGFDLASIKIIFFILFSLSLFYHYLIDYFSEKTDLVEYSFSSVSQPHEFAKLARFSPDKRFISYASSEQNSFNERLVLMTSGTLPRKSFSVSESQTYLLDIAWSPDSKSIAYSHWNNFYERKCGITLIRFESSWLDSLLSERSKSEVISNQTAANITSKQIMECNPRSAVTMAWSHDGKTLYFNDRKSFDRPYAVFSYSLISNRLSQLTLPPQHGNLRGDYRLIGRDDGQKLMVIRYQPSGSNRVSIYGVDQQLNKGENSFETNIPDTQFTLGSEITSASWYGNEDALIVFRDDILYRYDYNNDSYRELHSGSEGVFDISTSSDSERILFTRQNANTDIVSYRLDQNSYTQPITQSRFTELMPAYASLSKQVAFLSNRSGKNQIWIQSDDGAATQVSYSPSSLGLTPLKWSPNDSQILFQYEDEIYALTIADKSIRRVIEKLHQPATASWSVDGKYIFYSSDKSNEWQIWQYDIETEEHRQVTEFGGYSANQHLNGDLYVSKIHQSGLWRLPLNKTDASQFGDAEKVVDSFEGTNWLSWNISADNIYYFDGKNGEYGIFEYQINTKTIKLVLPFTGRQRRYFSVKGHRIALTELTGRRSSIERLDKMY